MPKLAYNVDQETPNVNMAEEKLLVKIVEVQLYVNMAEEKLLVKIVEV